MNRKAVLKKVSALVAAVAVMVAGSTWAGGAAQAADNHVLISGSGSSWAAIAVSQWIGDVSSKGLQVVFTAQGSAQGRQGFAQGTTDFGVSDIGFQGVDSKGNQDTNHGRDYAYLPIVAGGTSFPYQVRVGGKLIRNIRLSSATIAGIFTNNITNWNDPAIKRDNNNRGDLPNLKIIPVVHSEGSGSTYQFTAYLESQQPAIWNKYLSSQSQPAGATEYFPRSGNQVSQNGSDGVVNFLTSAAANGAIAFDEYSYALNKLYPVAAVLNAAGYYTLPDQYNVAVALTQAIINTDKSSPNYLLQDLRNVYGYSDPRVYPLSSYSYMIIPTSAADKRMGKSPSAKRQTLADYLYYAICQGQAETGPIGYSPLPINLVQAGFDQIALLHQADPGVDLSSESVATCNNPTFIKGQPNVNHLAVIAPQPPACAKDGAGPCVDGTTKAQTGSGGGGNAGGSANGNAAGSTGASEGPAGNGSGGAAADTAADDNAAEGDAANGASTASNDVAGQPTTLASASSTKGLDVILALLAAVLLMGVLVVPVLVGRRMGGRR